MDGGLLPVVHRLGEFVLHMHGALGVDGERVIDVDRGAAVVLDQVGLVVQHGGAHVVLGMHGELFLAGCVVHRHLVVTGALVGGRLGTAEHPLARQGKRRGLLAVVDAAHHQRPVGVALEIVDHDLLADARNGHAAPGLAGPGLADPDPAGVVLVALAQPVPVEVHLDPAVLVGVDLLPGRPHHDCGVQAIDHRPRRGAARAKGDGTVHGREATPVARFRRP